MSYWTMTSSCSDGYSRLFIEKKAVDDLNKELADEKILTATFQERVECRDREISLLNDMMTLLKNQIDNSQKLKQ